MFPSAIGEGSFKGYRDLSLPLADWNIYQSFDSAKDCESAKDSLENKLLPSVRASTGNARERAFTDPAMRRIRPYFPVRIIGHASERRIQMADRL